MQRTHRFSRPPRTSASQATTLGRAMLAHAAQGRAMLSSQSRQAKGLNTAAVRQPRIVSPSPPPIAGLLLDMGFAMPHILSAITATGNCCVMTCYF